MVTELESRRLLAITVVGGGPGGETQDGHDLVGPDASPGSDGIQDLHLSITGLATTAVDQIVVLGPAGFEWATQLDPNGYSLAEFFPTSQTSVDLYINPQVKSDLPPVGQSLPLGGSTGSLIQLQDGNQLTFQIYYQGSTTYITPEPTFTLSSSNYTSPTDPEPQTFTPLNPVITTSFTVAEKGQPTTVPYSYLQGMDHLQVTAGPGTFSTSQFAGGNHTQDGLLFVLSDDAGIEWDSTAPSDTHNHIYAYYDTSSIADLYFPPVRDESPVNGSTAPTMTLQLQLSATITNVYTCQFMPAAYDLALLYNPLTTNTTPPSADPTNGYQLQQDLNSTSPIYNVIDLPPGQTVYADQPIQISQSVEIVGNGASLVFDQGYSYSGGSTANWPSGASGAIYVNNPGDTHIQVDLEDFTIKFTSAPVWNNPTGDTPPTWDPENLDPNYGYTHAVIDTGDINTTENTQELTLDDMSITGPPAYDTASFQNLYNAAEQQSSLYDFVGEPDMLLVNTDGGSDGVSDFGTITGCTFQGGNVNLYGGPWNVTNNVVLGAAADTYSTAAFALTSAHDVLLEGNQVSQSASTGTLFRLVNLAGGESDNVTVEDNTFGGNAGSLGGEVYYAGKNGTGNDIFNGVNDPEVMLEESSSGMLFEGRPAAISSDGRLVILPNVRTAVSGFEPNSIPTGPGDIVSILAGVSSSSTPDMTMAGEWFRVAQTVQVIPGSDGFQDLELLMQDPLPAMPAGGYYVIEVTSGYVNSSFINNSINLTNKTSVGLVLDGTAFGTRVIGNLFDGGTEYFNRSNGTAISIAPPFNVGAGSGTDAYPADWSVLPELGTLVEDNVILDSLGGVEIGVLHNEDYANVSISTSSETGRVYVTATVVGNVFEQDQSWLSAWETDYLADGNSPGESTTPPTITVGSGFSAEAPGIHGSPRFPWTVGGLINGITPIFVDPTENVVDVQGNIAYTIESNGALLPQQEPTGQVYAGIVNGNTVESSLVPEQNNSTVPGYNGGVYYPFNVNTGLPGNPDSGNQLNISDAPTTTQGIQALMLGQDNYDLVGAGTGTPTPDGTQDLHLELTGLSSTAIINSIEVVDDISGEEWVWPESGSSNQIVVDHASGSTTADIFIEPTASHLDDPFTIDLVYNSGGPIAIPVNGVMFNPMEPVLPGVPQAPLDLGVTSTGTNQVSLSWSASAGAATYTVERALASSPANWTTLTPTVTTTSFTDTSGLTGGTPYLYQVFATSALGASSPLSQIIAATTTTPPTNVLTLTAVSCTTSEGFPFSGDVATFTYSNTSTPASSFTATINWGDGVTQSGTIYGSNGSFTVGNSHTYSAFGDFNIQVQVSLTSGSTSATTVSTMIVTANSAEISLPYNQVGITSPGSGTEGLIDSSNQSYTSLALGNPATWGPNSFYIAGPTSDNVVEAVGQTLAFSGSGFSAIELLGAATGGINQAGVFTVDYSGGAYDQDTLGFSDWNQGYNGAGTNAPGEVIVLNMPYLNTYTGGTEVQSQKNSYLYGYIIPVNPAKSLTGLVLPSNPNIKIVALDLIIQPPQVNLTSYFNTIGITASGSSVAGQLGGNKSYSSTAIGGSTVTWGANTFDLGAANTDNVMAAVGQTVALPAGNYASIEVLGASANGNNQGLRFWVDYSDGSQDSVTLGFSDWSRGYNGAGTNAPDETTVLTTSYNVYSGSTETLGSGSVYLYGYTIPVNPNKTVTGLQVGDNDAVDILAIDLIQHPEQVNLGYGNSGGVALPYDEIGISSTNGWNQGGIDSAGDTFSAAAAPTGLGNRVTWNAQSFVFGPGGTNNVVEASGQSITLSPGNYTSLDLLGASTSGYEETALFYVYYTNGSYDTFTQAFSDWRNGYTGTPGSTAPGESIVESPSTYNKLASGPTPGTVYLYGYVFPLNPAKTVAYIKLPTDTSIKVLAMDEVDQPEQVNLGAGTTAAGVPVAGNQIGIGTTLTNSQGNLDGKDDAYSSAAQPAGLGNSVTWNGQTFAIGPAAIDDFVQADGQAIELPEGEYTSLMILGASTSGFPETNLFSVHYTDSSFDTITQAFSDWQAGYTGTLGSTAPGESVALAMNTYLSPTAVVSQHVDLYGYVFPVNPGKTVAYLQLPDDPSVVILAIDEVYQPAQATFLKQDTTTQGNWSGVYGSQGYNVLGSGASNPTYATVTASGQTLYTWATPPTTAVQALEVPPAGPSRVAAAWYSATSFTIDVNVAAGHSYNLELYFLDYDARGRAETVTLNDANTGALLDSESVSNFANGEYLSWTISGNVLITITRTAGVNALLNGLFFDPPTPPSASASFIGSDTTTQGNWSGVYGSQGYNVLGSGASNPTYATVTASGETLYTWATPPTTAVQALEVPPAGPSRVAAAWYSATSFTIDVNVAAGHSYNLELYFLDYDAHGRAETVKLTDANSGALLGTESVSNFVNGEYLSWAISGNVLITITCTAGGNAVLDGLFFDPPTAPPPASASFVGSDTTTQGNWSGVYGSQGYNVIGSGASNPTYATVTASGQTLYTWATPPTTAVQALEVPPAGPSRVAAAWYSATSFTIDVNVAAGHSYNLELYFLDYDAHGRAETVALTAANTGASLNSQSVSNFANGEYLNWTISGNVVITITCTAGGNGVVNGLFFDPPTP